MAAKKKPAKTEEKVPVSCKRDPETGLTPREAQFVSLWDGGQTSNAKIARTIGTNKAVISHFLRRPHVIEAIQNRIVTDKLAPLVADRIELQRFWTDQLRDEKCMMKDRLKASEMLGKSHAIFVEKVERKDVTFEDFLALLREQESQK